MKKNKQKQAKKQENSFPAKAKKPLGAKKEIRDAGRFVLALVAIFAVLYLFSSLAPARFFEKPVAQGVLFSLQALGIDGRIVEAPDADVEIVLANAAGTRIIISYLCTGLLEFLLLVSAIVASFGIGARKKLFGIIGALFVTALFNILRIVVSVLLILGTNIQAASLAHDLLFRATLFAVIAGYYGIWFWIAARKKP